MNEPHWSMLPAASRKRFSLTMVLLVTACVAGLFALSHTMRAPWFAPILCVALLLYVWAAQWCFRLLGRPQIIAALAGVTFISVCFVGLNLYDPIGSPKLFAFLGLSLLAIGALAGYFAGWIGSWIFWTDALLRDSLQAKRIEREKLHAAMGVVPPESPWDEQD